MKRYQRILLEVLLLEKLGDLFECFLFFLFVLVDGCQSVSHSTLELHTVLGTFDLLNHHDSEVFFDWSCT